MSKLRIRTLDGTTHRLAVDQDCTVHELKQAVGEMLGNVGDLQLSLNKKVRLLCVCEGAPIPGPLVM